MTTHTHVPPSDCPVCGERLTITRLGCASCGSELSGRFASCSYCSLAAHDQRILSAFLVSRGNMKELARDLGVSYPTARQRFAELLVKLGLEDAESVRSSERPGGTEGVAAEGAVREDILRRLAVGEISLDEAEAALRGGVAAQDQ